MYLMEKCFKIDRPNAKAMINGFTKNGAIHRQSIWMSVRDFQSPALITLQRAPTPFKLSNLGQKMNPDNFILPLKYIAILDSEYFIRNNINLWEKICANNLFDIWDPQAPFSRFSQAQSNPEKFRIQLLRIYEINHEFKNSDIIFASSRIDRLIQTDKDVEIVKPVISDYDFLKLKNLLLNSIVDFLTRTKSHNTLKNLEKPSLPSASTPTDLTSAPTIAPSSPSATSSSPSIFETSKEDIESFKFEHIFVEGEKVGKFISHFERNPRLRAAAICYHGTVCKICGFDFNKFYGHHGHNFIEVHHLKPVSSLKQPTRVDPESDMTVVCSNCHRMIHRKKDNILTPDQVAEMIKKE